MVADAVALDRDVSDRWYVSNGAASVGPVSLELIARGVEAGKVPLESFVRNETWKVWRPLTELVLPEQDEGEDGDVEPVVPAPSEVQNSSLRGDDMSAEDAIAGATDEREALLLLMAAVVREIGADAALVHAVRGDAAVVVCAHGGDLFEGLGERLAMNDPAVVAATAGAILIAEPVAGPAGAVVRRRLGRGKSMEGAAVFPLRVEERLFGMLELGRATRFLPRELARVEVLVGAVIARLSPRDATPQNA
ncbi:MAG TPA: hypothetical protein VHB21_06180 [Minicystis sp.]|nr:hypothetical protein [Minicystis sp.]